MAGGIFVDTSAWYALADKVDVNHGLATEFFPRAMAEYREIVSTNHVIGETYTLIVSRLGRDAAWLFLRNIRKSGRLKRVFVSEKQEGEAYGLLERYSDQDLSFVDSTSFVVMRDQGISFGFAFDRHFAAAGFTVLPAPG